MPNLIYNTTGLTSIVIFTFLAFYGDYLGIFLSPFVLSVTVLAAFSSYKFGFYGPYYLLFVLIPFSQSVTLFTLANRPVNMGMHTMVVGIIIFATILRKSIRFYILKDNSIKILIFMGIWTLTTIIISATHAPVSTLSNSLVTWLRWVQFMPIALLIVQSVGITKYFKKFITLFIALGFVVAIWGIYQTINPSDFALKAFRGAATFTKPLFRERDEAASFSLTTSASEGAFYMGSANYNIAGAFMAVITLISIPFLTSINSIKKIPVGKFGVLILMIGIAVTQSRSALIAFLIGLLVNSNSKSKKALLYTFLTVVFCGIIFFTFFSEYWLGPIIKETVTKLPEAIPIALDKGIYSENMGFTANVFGAAMRVVGIRQAFIGFLEAPIFGWGFFGFATYAPYMGTAENFYMQFLCETGFIGFALLMLYFRAIWVSTKTKFLEDSFAARFQRGFRSAFVAFLVVNFTGTLFYDTRIWGLMLVLSAIQIRLTWDERKKKKLGEIKQI